MTMKIDDALGLSDRALLEALQGESLAEVTDALCEPLVLHKVKGLVAELRAEHKRVKASLPGLETEAQAAAVRYGELQAEVLRLRGEVAQAVPDWMRATREQTALHDALTAQLNKATEAWQAYSSMPARNARLLKMARDRLVRIDALVDVLSKFAASDDARRVRQIVLA